MTIALEVRSTQGKNKVVRSAQAVRSMQGGGVILNAVTLSDCILPEALSYHILYILYMYVYRSQYRVYIILSVTDNCPFRGTQFLIQGMGLIIQYKMTSLVYVILFSFLKFKLMLIAKNDIVTLFFIFEH